MKQKFKLVSRKELDQINRSTYLVWVYMDMAEKEVVNLVQITQEFDMDKQMIKHYLEQMKKLAIRFRNEMNHSLRDRPDLIEQFGEVADAYEIKIKKDLYLAMKEELGI